MKVSGHVQTVVKALIAVLYAALLWKVFSAWQNPATRSWFEPHSLGEMGRDLLATPLGPLAVLGGYVVAVLAGIPVGVMVVAGVLIFGAWPGMAYAWVGMLTGAVVAYGMGRFLGGKVLERMTGRLAPALQQAMNRHGLGAVVFVRVVPMAPYMVGNLTFGALKVSLRTYALGTALGLLPITVLTALFLDRLAAAWQDPSATTWLWVLALVGAVAAAVALVRRQLRAGLGP